MNPSPTNSSPGEPGPRPVTGVRRVVIASLVGTSLEWYDFFIYGTAAALVFNKLFFPSFEPLVGTLLAFTTYAVGFIARPVGGIVFGHYGDQVGRKKVLVATLILMGVATFAIGLLPTYASIGIWAPILLVSLRFLQGLGLGGEWGGAVLMTLESGDSRRRGLNASWPQVGVPIGLLLANGVLSLMGAVTGDEAFLQLGMAGAVPAQRRAGAGRAVDPDEPGGEPGVRRGGRAGGGEAAGPDRAGAAPLPPPGAAGHRRPGRGRRRLLRVRPVHRDLRGDLPEAAQQLRAERGADRGGLPDGVHPGLRWPVRPLRPAAAAPDRGDRRDDLDVRLLRPARHRQLRR